MDLDIKSREKSPEKIETEKNDDKRYYYQETPSYIDTIGKWDNKKKNAPVEKFVRKITKQGLSYAEAQKLETLAILKKKKQLDELGDGND